jgi:hypothetical protein
MPNLTFTGKSYLRPKLTHKKGSHAKISPLEVEGENLIEPFKKVAKFVSQKFESEESEE